MEYNLDFLFEAGQVEIGKLAKIDTNKLIAAWIVNDETEQGPKFNLTNLIVLNSEAYPNFIKLYGRFPFGLVLMVHPSMLYIKVLIENRKFWIKKEAVVLY